MLKISFSLMFFYFIYCVCCLNNKFRACWLFNVVLEAFLILTDVCKKSTVSHKLVLRHCAVICVPQFTSCKSLIILTKKHISTFTNLTRQTHTWKYWWAIRPAISILIRSPFLCQVYMNLDSYKPGTDISNGSIGPLLSSKMLLLSYFYKTVRYRGCTLIFFAQALYQYDIESMTPSMDNPISTHLNMTIPTTCQIHTNSNIHKRDLCSILEP